MAASGGDMDRKEGTNTGRMGDNKPALAIVP